jgi:glycerophosphoryl diester phosphodiesterase
MGPVQQRLPSLLAPPVGFAHRGARAHVKENTLEAFTLALRLGATGLETDTWLTADGEVVLDHDGIVRGRARKRPVSALRRSELPSYIPTLTELFERCGTDYHLAIDIKDPRTGPPIISIVREAAPDLMPRLWLCHDWAVVATLRTLDADVKLVDSTRLARVREGAERRADTLAREGINAINMHHSDWTGGLTTLFHRFGRYTLAWDLQHEDLLRNVLRMGIDGVFSDWTDRMVDAINAETTA